MKQTAPDLLRLTLMRLTLIPLTLLIALPIAAAERDRLEKGEVIVQQRAVEGSDMPEAIMKAVVDAPLERIQAVLDKCENYKRVMPRTKASKELSRKGNVVHCRITIDMPFPFDDLTATTRAVHTAKPGYFERAWTLVEGDYKRNTGAWRLTPFDKEGKRTLVHYRVHAEPNTSVPVWVQKKASSSTLPGLIEALAKASGAKKRGD